MRPHLLFLFVLLAQVSGAVEFTRNGITYRSTGTNTVQVFRGNDARGNLQLPEKIMEGTVEYTVTSIGDSAFIHDFDLTGITLPSSLTRIGKSAFGGCVNLGKILLPASLDELGSGALLGCRDSILVESGNTSFSSLKGVLFDFAISNLLQCPTTVSGIYTVPATVTEISTDAFWRCGKLRKIVFPATIRTIGPGAFSGCIGLLQADLPPTLVGLPTYAFGNCSNLSKVTLHEATGSIASAAFWNCNALTLIESWSSLPPTIPDTTVFYHVNKITCQLNVAVGSLGNYQAAFGWKQFAGIADNLAVSVGNRKAGKPKAFYNAFSNSIETREIDQEEQLVVYDRFGSLVFSGTIDGSCQLPQLLPGLYLARILRENSNIYLKFNR